MNEPLVSILSPCYNVEQYLPQCIESIINQTYNNLQIVMIDDGSSDGTWNVLLNYAGKDSRIEVCRQENQGVASTRNNLLDKVKGEYVLFVDSDDWIEPDMVEFLVGKSLTHRADIVVCGMVKNNAIPCGEYTEELMDQETTIKKFLFHKELSGSLCNKLVKTSLLQGIRFDARISYGEDALFCWHVLQRVKTVVQTDRQLYHYRMNANSLSHLNWTPEKKGSGHLVWEAITNETQTLWPQYLNIAKARFAMEDFWGLYYAAICDYPYDDEIAKRQKHVRNSLSLIKHSGLMSRNKLFFALIICRRYGFGSFLKMIRKIKGQDTNIQY